MSGVSSPVLPTESSAILPPLLHRSFARTPFGTRFYKLSVDADSIVIAKRPINGKMWEEIRAWEKLQCTVKLPENRQGANVLQRNPLVAGNDLGADHFHTVGRVAAAGMAVGKAGYPNYFASDVGGLRDVRQTGKPPLSTTRASIDEDLDRLWPDAYSIVSDSDIEYELDGFVVIDEADVKGSVFWKNSRRRCHKVSLLYTTSVDRQLT